MTDRTSSDNELFTGDISLDLESASLDGTKEDVKAVLEYYSATLVTSNNGINYYRIPSDESDDPDVAVLYDNGDAETKEFTELLYDIGDGHFDKLSYEDILGYDVSNHIEEEIYRQGGINYHVTTRQRAIKILKTGVIEKRSETRGISNKAIGPAIFTSEKAPDDVYGDVVFEIDIDAMVDDNFTPRAGKELPVKEAIAKEAVADKFMIDGFFAEVDPSISRDTNVFYEDIPIEYVRIDADSAVLEDFRETLQNELESGNMTESEFEKAVSVLHNSR